MYSFVKNVLCTMSRTNTQPLRIHLFFYGLALLSFVWIASCQTRQETAAGQENRPSDTSSTSRTAPEKATESCLDDATLPLSERQACLRALVCENLHQQNFARVLALDSRYGAGLAMPRDDRFDYHSLLDSVRTHIARVDSLKSLPLPPDSLAFFQAASLLAVCQTSCFLSEGCYDFSPALTALNEFTEKYPQSLLADNARYLYWFNFYCGEGGYNDGQMQELENQFRRILTRYPDTDLRDELEFQIWATVVERSNPDVAKIKRLGAEYLRRFPQSPRATRVRETLAQF